MCHRGHLYSSKSFNFYRFSSNVPSVIVILEKRVLNYSFTASFYLTHRPHFVVYMLAGRRQLSNMAITYKCARSSHNGEIHVDRVTCVEKAQRDGAEMSDNVWTQEIACGNHPCVSLNDGWPRSVEPVRPRRIIG